jgi:prevent-host-death family protein
VKTIDIHDAKTHLSRLVEEAALGHEIVIAKVGRPVARLVPLAPAVTPKRLGALRGRLTVPEDFDAPLDPATLRDFEGS